MVSYEDSGTPAGAFPLADIQVSRVAQAYEDDVRYAGFWIRLVAYIIDLILVDILMFIPVVVIFTIAHVKHAPKDDDALGLLTNGIVLFGTLLYYAIFTASAWQ